MKRRTPVDLYKIELEELLRHQLEMLYFVSPIGTALHDLCNECIDLELDGILKSMPDITSAQEAALNAGELKISNPYKSSIENEPESAKDIAIEGISINTLDDSAQAISTSAQSLIQALEAYNGFITRSYTEVLMAKMLGMETEETLAQDLHVLVQSL